MTQLQGPMASLQLSTMRLNLRLPMPGDAERILEYRIRNRSFFERTETFLPPNFYSSEFWERHIMAAQEDFDSDRAVRLLLHLCGNAEVIGHINFTQIFRAGFQACYVGYALDERQQGNGYMTEALTDAIRYMFEVRNMHRIMANYLPTNERSARLLERLGFEIEGRAKNYLWIGGRWQDHVMTSLTNNNWHDFQ